MDRVLPYLLLVLLVIATLDESLTTRYKRLTGQEEEKTRYKRLTGQEEEKSVQTVSVPTSKPTPFWQDPQYRTGLDKADEKLEKRNSKKTGLY